MASPETLSKLRQRILNQQVVVVVGAGVSMQATGRHACASWRGLIESGIQWCEARRAASGCDAEWGRRKRASLASGGAREFLGVANEVAGVIGEASGELLEWLKGTVGSLEARHPEILRSLHAMGCQLVTTNYDALLDHDGLRPVTWQNPSLVFGILRGDQQGIIHLHGRWDEPESVVLGFASYGKVRDEEHPKSVLRSLAMMKTLLFVGCGEGLSDPNFATFREWLREVNASNESPHYRLCTQEEKARWAREHDPRERIELLEYGDRFEDLPGFLMSLAPDRAPAPVMPTGSSMSLPASGATGRTSDAAAPHTESIRGYVRRLDDQVRRLSLVGFGVRHAVYLPIERAYVPLRLESAGSFDLRDIGGRGLAESKASPESERRDIDVGQVFALAAKADARGVLILGDPGAGKTTAVRQLCRTILTDPDPAATLTLPQGVVPVLLRLRDMSPGQIGEPWKFVDAALCPPRPEDAHDGGPGGVVAVTPGDSPGPDLRRRKGVLWIFDGLDEVVDEGSRVRMAAWIAKVAGERPDDRFLVTCRYAGYQGEVSLGPDFAVFKVQPLNTAQVRDFVQRWHDVVCPRLNPNAAEADITRIARQKSESLLAILATEPYRVGAVRHLPANPLLLTILCLVHHDERDQLPDLRATVYEKCVDVLVNEWRKELLEKQGITKAGAEAAIHVLAAIAWWLHSEDQRTADALPAVAKVATGKLAGLSEARGLGRDGEAFVRQMRDLSGILAPDGPGRCGFLHLTFQEFLAAHHAVHENQAAKLAERLGSTWWREVILLAMARGHEGFATQFFTALAGRPGVVVEHEDFVRKVVGEAQYKMVTPMVELLRTPGRDRRLPLALLRVLRGHPSPDFLAACRRLAVHGDGEVARLAAELLVAQGETPPAPTDAALGWRGWLRRLMGKAETPTRVTASHVIITTDPVAGIALVDVPAGEFLMGSDKGDPDEIPVHPVRVSAFRMGRYPVTNAEYGRFLAAHPGTPEPAYWADSQFNDPRQPVVGIDWEEAMAFCRWIGGRLPTEAEWEYACRAGTTTEYAFGNTLTHKMANFEDKVGATSAVDRYPANPWGLHDMHGNVWERCADWWDDDYYARSPVQDPTGPEKGDGRVLRGGCWYSPAVYCRSACRRDWLPGLRSRHFGFRVVLAPRSVH